MEINHENPPTNQIGPGLSEETVVSAVEESGYPLQVFVSDLLQEKYHVEEEWSYLDRDSDGLRALDMRASMQLYDWKDFKEQPRVRPSLDLLIECKQSELPYVFFESKVQSY
jgi:hypothetical protein